MKIIKKISDRKKVRDIINLDVKRIYSYALYNKEADLSILEDAIIKKGYPEYVYKFARDIEGADIKKLEDAIKKGGAEHIYGFARDIEGADIKKELNGKQRGVRYAEKMFNAALLCYFDRFGFEESEPQVAIAKLFKWAYAVRLDLEYLGPNTPNKYALGGDGNYANRIALFAKIKNAREHSEITDMALNVASKEHTDNGKWGFLRDMLVEL